MKNEFRDARAQLNEEERVARREDRKLNSPVDRWTKGGVLTHEALDHLRDLRLREREDILPADRRCPRCGIVKLSSRQWVILHDGVWCERWRPMLHAWVRRKERELAAAARQDREPRLPANPFSAICRSCNTFQPDHEAELGNFLTTELWWKIDHKAVKVARYTLELTGQEVAEACGWSQSRQSKIETRSVSLLSDDDVSKLQLMLKLETRPTVGSPHRKYVLEGAELKRVRQAVGVSRMSLAQRVGVSASRIAQLEQKKQTRIEPRVAESLTAALGGMDRAAETVSD